MHRITTMCSPCRPNGTVNFVSTSPATVEIITGPVVNEARQTFVPWLTQVVRLWAAAPSADFEFTVGPVPWSDHLGKEIISRFSTGMATASTWMTDSNCRDSQKRVLNFRPTWNLTVHEPVAGNCECACEALCVVRCMPCTSPSRVFVIRCVIIKYCVCECMRSIV